MEKRTYDGAEKRRRVIVWLLFLVTVAFIWGNSLLPVGVSREISDNTGDWLFALLQGSALGRFVLLHVRKIAHFFEFTVLGVELFYLTGRGRPTRRMLWRCLSAGLWIAVADESLQILSDRGPQVQDVLLDMGGVLHGWVWAMLITCLIRRVRAARRKKAGARDA